MKPILSESDYKTIHTFLQNLPLHLKGKEVSQLQQEIKSAKIIADDAISDEVIQINSRFEVSELSSGTTMNFQLVLSHQADLKKNRISVLSPLGVALIGFRQGMTVECMLPGGLKKLQINWVEKSGLLIQSSHSSTERTLK
ncbi:GreA/GreB family elongation factor [Algoriphagus sp. CAU 1675]|uniref:GreA/GreB family elongation factor n=1 Tax=Algoriphagus sp. CAU 1675 TaxID=3032597 RepID=UPI0023DC7785|nr:GreA/GreB family elongation factor [Algoriphagus sp. CAU 1675]MDF2156495.1 GreA/GreB family elongation factor [Algoriphagus sp. CAU 1675]